MLFVLSIQKLMESCAVKMDSIIIIIVVVVVIIIIITDIQSSILSRLENKERPASRGIEPATQAEVDIDVSASSPLRWTLTSVPHRL